MYTIKSSVIRNPGRDEFNKYFNFPGAFRSPKVGSVVATPEGVEISIGDLSSHLPFIKTMMRRALLHVEKDGSALTRQELTDEVAQFKSGVPAQPAPVKPAPAKTVFTPSSPAAPLIASEEAEAKVEYVVENVEDLGYVPVVEELEIPEELPVTKTVVAPSKPLYSMKKSELLNLLDANGYESADAESLTKKEIIKFIKQELGL